MPPKPQHEVIHVDAWGLKLDIPATKKNKAIFSIVVFIVVLIVGWHNLDLGQRVDSIQSRLEECEKLERSNQPPWAPGTHSTGFAMFPQIAGEP